MKVKWVNKSSEWKRVSHSCLGEWCWIFQAAFVYFEMSVSETWYKIHSFDVQECKGCSCDKVVIFQRELHKRGRFRKCGSELPEFQISYTKHLYMEFITDKSITRRGFMFEYSTTFGRKYHCVDTIILFPVHLHCPPKPIIYSAGVGHLITVILFLPWRQCCFETSTYLLALVICCPKILGVILPWCVRYYKAIYTTTDWGNLKNVWKSK